MSLTDEMKLTTKLTSLGIDSRYVFDGVTSQAERRETVRALVKRVPDVIFSVREGREITMRMMFVATYGDEL